MSFMTRTGESTRNSFADNVARLKKEIESAEFVVIGAGAGLSTSAGFVYSGDRFNSYFFDFRDKFGIKDMYSGGFYPFPDDETRWAWWSRNIYFNRYVEAPKPVYRQLYELIKAKDYFVITTNVDHQFQKSGFDKERLFYTQGDYGLFQSTNPDIRKTYDNEEWVFEAMQSQGFALGEDEIFHIPADGRLKMRIPSSLIPKCPDDGSNMTMNLRADDTFGEDEGWHEASERYTAFLEKASEAHVLYMELGVGGNTPVIIKYPFWRLTYANEKAVYACLNFGEAVCPKEIEERAICSDGDIGDIINAVKCE